MKKRQRRAKVGRHHPRSVRVWQPGEHEIVKKVGAALGFSAEFLAGECYGSYSPMRAAARAEWEVLKQKSERMRG